jgi:hypothetical protein
MREGNAHEIATGQVGRHCLLQRKDGGFADNCGEIRSTGKSKKRHIK